MISKFTALAIWTIDGCKKPGSIINYKEVKQFVYYRNICIYNFTNICSAETMYLFHC